MSRSGQLVGPGAEVAVRSGKWWTRCGAVVRPAGIVDLDPHDTRRSEASALTGPPDENGSGNEDVELGELHNVENPGDRARTERRMGGGW